MPFKVPTYHSSREPARRGTPGVRPDMEAAGLGVISAAQKSSAILQAYNEKMHKAEQVTALSNAQTDLIQQMAGFENEIKDRTDYENFEPEFDKRVQELKKHYSKQISDRDVLQAFRLDFERQVLRTRVAIRQVARKQSVDKGRADFADNYNVYDEIIKTDRDYDRRLEALNSAKILVARNVDAGYISRQEGVDRINVLNQSAKKAARHSELIRAMHDLRADPGKFDPAGYSLITDDERIKLSDHADRLNEARQKEALRKRDRVRQEAEKELKDRREKNAMSLTVSAIQGALSEDELIDQARRREITRSDFLSIKKIMDVDPSEAKDDELVRLSLTDDIYEGKGSRDAISNAYLTGKITGKTAENLLGKLHQEAGDEGITKNPEYKEAVTHIKNNLKTTGIMDKFDTTELPRIENALDEFRTRIRKGEPIVAVRDDIVRRYRPKPLTAGAYPRPLYGDKQDIGAAFRRTQQAYENKEIDFATYRREVWNLKRLQDIQDRTDRDTRETGKVDAEEYKKKINRRK